jgi:hypothetical protein
MSKRVVARTVAYLVEMVWGGLAVAIPFVEGWNGRARAKSTVASASVAFSQLWGRGDELAKGDGVSKFDELGVHKV